MGKYQALGEYLKKRPGELVPMTFAEIESVTGVKLPMSARKYRPWWSNNARNSVMTKVWLAAGFVSEQVDMRERRLVFRRVRGPTQADERQSRQGQSCHPAYGFMKGLVSVPSGTDLTAPADPAWADRLDAQHGREKRAR